MDGRRMGELHMSRSGSLSYEYDSAYASEQGATPLSLSMPLGQSRHGNRVVLPFLEGLLPDNPLAIQAMSRRYQVSAQSPFALLEHVGHDVAGALQLVRPGEESEDSTANRTSMRPIDDHQLSSMLRDILDVYGSGTAWNGTQRMSLAGAQAKLALTRTTNGCWAVPQRGTPSTCIVKPLPIGTETFPDADIVELFCQNVVAAIGLPAARSTLWTSPDETMRAVVSERYDRERRGDGTYRRLHQEDFCQAMSIPPTRKHQRQDGGPGIGQIGRLFATRLEPESMSDVGRSFLRAVTANAALLNTDAHAKNYSLMLSGSGVVLSPLYDVVSIGAFLGKDEHPLFPMRLGTTFDLEQVFPETLVASARSLRIAKDEAADIVDDTLSSLDAQLDSVAEEMAGMDVDGIISRTVEAIRRHSALLTSMHHE
ncbi:HipA domain-containing protein [uncultured Bifidobacterium sp.]|uniref:HipA domain-containing protein n=1 Tax=uncultured Bifidobacterium sp. TaxID=165187 RepID=UPI0026342359|nr:HipA domain-containing protein [uncultured Bifidobacterium sp.]